jgi:superfamily II DNA/RNA helicase
MGWNQPSGIQSKTIPLILNTDKNIIAQSQVSVFLSLK